MRNRPNIWPAVCVKRLSADKAYNFRYKKTGIAFDFSTAGFLIQKAELLMQGVGIQPFTITLAPSLTRL